MDQNTRIANELEKVAEHYTLAKEPYKARAYRNAAKAIKTHQEPITSKAQALKIKGVGKSVAETIETFLSTGVTDRLLDTNREKEETIALFKTVHGIGPAKALELYNEGKRTIKDLKSAQLNTIQSLGVKWHNDITQRIPRIEIDMFGSYFNSILQGMRWDIAGSYRRGYPDSGDIDLLISSGDGVPKEVLENVVDLMQDKLVANLGQGDTKYMGVIKLIPEWIGRRIDIRVVEPRSYASALLYFTGSVEYSIFLRNTAIKKCMIINEYCIEVPDAPGKESTKIYCDTEEEIHKVLEIPYLPPTQR
jgi:DNA polymerase/3'-5' exonuclease PolX